MAIFRCKMCGGDLQVVEGTSYCTCDSCGTTQTIPTVQEVGLKNLFNRANVLRMKAEFDRAAEIYEKKEEKENHMDHNPRSSGSAGCVLGFCS